MPFPVSRAHPVVAVLLAAIVSACATPPAAVPPLLHVGTRFVPPPPPFEAEPTAHETFSGPRAFSAGARLRFVSFSLSAQEQLRLQRCGAGCSTAKLVRSWSQADFDKSPAQELVLQEAGDYYLWLRQELPNGEVGAVPAVAATFDRENGVLRFASGTSVFVAVDGTGMPVDRSDDPVRIATEPVQDPDSALRKLEWPGILEKARHGVRQDLIVAIAPGEVAESLLRDTFPVPGADLSRDPDTVARRRAALDRYRVALHDVKARMMVPLRAAGVEMTQDFDVVPTIVATVSTEAELRALQASPQVTSISENHRVTLD
jgi:hypothetical protein